MNKELQDSLTVLVKTITKLLEIAVRIAVKEEKKRP